MNVRIAQLHLYPVKGCRGVSLTRAALAPTGLVVDPQGAAIGDREWVVADADGAFLSQRTHPKMALIETRLTSTHLRLKAPGMLLLEVPYASEGDVVEVRVWNDTVPAVTQGEVADAWLTQFLGTPARLLRFDPEHTRLADPAATGAVVSPFKFADAFALLVTNTASLVDLNRRLEGRGGPVGMERFRPNIVLEGLPAYEEDHVQALRVNGATLRLVKRCARCTVPGVDPATGTYSDLVPDALAVYRRFDDGVMFGMNAIVAQGEGCELRVGDAVEVELAL
ncbi:MAG: MOSC N-terminal beta barrel domain-containing protein [Sutterellaceae bacterium]|nr:MOSC N-terminal beta barrel domain-containing protein [Burkholderiaceae bacterium]MCX7901429.1 MOSC N-terminal beta barrel domain-containing protein [Burkholderiaceae bacterium]MDW8428908.1 MOSC N-terminal beta barrel domain-containing protein [Sutterellaceae bacterium]